MAAALEKIAKITGAGLSPWRQTLYIDHYLDGAPENASVLLSHPRTLREIRDALYRLSYPQSFGRRHRPVSAAADAAGPLFQHSVTNAAGATTGLPPVHLLTTVEADTAKAERTQLRAQAQGVELVNAGRQHDRRVAVDRAAPQPPVSLLRAGARLAR